MNENKLISTYSSSHQNESNQLIHYICVPIIFFNVIAFIYYYSTLLITLALILSTLIFYYRSLPRFLPGIIILYSFALTACYFFAPLEVFIPANITLFVLAWIGQFWGHKIEGKNPSFLENVLFLLVGPAWVMWKLQDKFFKGQKS